MSSRFHPHPKSYLLAPKLLSSGTSISTKSSSCHTEESISHLVSLAGIRGSKGSRSGATLFYYKTPENGSPEKCTTVRLPLMKSDSPDSLKVSDLVSLEFQQLLVASLAFTTSLKEITVELKRDTHAPTTVFNVTKTLGSEQKFDVSANMAKVTSTIANEESLELRYALLRNFEWKAASYGQVYQAVTIVVEAEFEIHMSSKAKESWIKLTGKEPKSTDKPLLSRTKLQLHWAPWTSEETIKSPPFGDLIPDCKSRGRIFIGYVCYSGRYSFLVVL